MMTEFIDCCTICVYQMNLNIASKCMNLRFFLAAFNKNNDLQIGYI